MEANADDEKFTQKKKANRKRSNGKQKD